MRPSALYVFFTCLTPNDFTRQWGTLQLNGLTKKSDNVSGKPIEPQCAPVCLTYFFTCLTPDDFTRQWGSSAA
jgi:hypothetical protein